MKRKAEETKEYQDLPLTLERDDDGLYISSGGLKVRGDLARLKPRIKKNNLSQELLVKASKLKNTGEILTAVDATAGLGEDSLLLAAAGFKVILYEYDPVIAALLRDSLERAAEDPDLRETVSRMELREGDSIEGMKNLGFLPDVVYLDPMFPAREKSALIKKKFQLIHQLEVPCTDEESLLRAAYDAGPLKVVVKRPLKGAYLAGKKPDYSLTGKAIRYDVFVNVRKEA